MPERVTRLSELNASGVLTSLRTRQRHQPRRAARGYNNVVARANATNNKAVEDEITARNGSGSVIPGNVRNG
jgi:hypothetical protein